MMPDYGRRAEAQRSSASLNLPAHINVVARDPKCPVESANALERGFSESHVAARNMFREVIAQEHVVWAAGGMRDAESPERIVKGRKIGTAYSFVRTIVERRGKEFQPMNIRIGVIVEIRDDFTGARLKPQIAGTAKSPVLDGDDVNVEFVEN